MNLKDRINQAAPGADVLKIIEFVSSRETIESLASGYTSSLMSGGVWFTVSGSSSYLKGFRAWVASAQLLYGRMSEGAPACRALCAMNALDSTPGASSESVTRQCVEALAAGIAGIGGDQ